MFSARQSIGSRKNYGGGYRVDSEKLKNMVIRIGDLAKIHESQSGNVDAQKDVIFPVLSLEEFFEGNDDASSIGCNLEAEPKPEDIYAFLKSIRSRPNVSNVLVMVTQYDGPGSWPFYDRVYVITSASPEEVETWIPEDFKPAETGIGFGDLPYEETEIPEGMQAVWLWYD